MVIDGSGEQSKEDSRAKRDKMARPYPSLCGIVRQSGRDITYEVSGLDMSTSGRQDPDWARPWGLSDVASTTVERRIEADERLQPESRPDDWYDPGRVIRRSESQAWDPVENKTHQYEIRLDRTRDIEFANKGDLETPQPDRGGAFPWARPTIQQVSIASLTNNRPCHATEIGIKSEVWRQLTGAINKNGFPTPDTIEEYEQEGGQISVGSITKYIKRYSFFKLYARELGANDWLDITGEAPFAVRGTSPVAQYNTIHIEHPGRDEPATHEYRIEPSLARSTTTSGSTA